MTRRRGLPPVWLTAGRRRQEGGSGDMSMVSMLTWDRLEVDRTLDERQGAVMQERRYLAATVRGSEAQR